jgi:hypothetical protein
MFAMAMAQKTQAFTGAVHDRGDADMIKRPESEAVDGKTAPADRTRNFGKDVKGGLWTIADAKDPGLGLSGAQQPNRLLPAFGHDEVIVAQMLLFRLRRIDGAAAALKLMSGGTVGA